MHLAPDHLKGKINEILSSDINSFKHHCRDICDADQQNTKEAAKIMCCGGFRYNKQRSKPNYFYKNQGHIDPNQNTSQHEGNILQIKQNTNEVHYI